MAVKCSWVCTKFSSPISFWTFHQRSCSGCVGYSYLAFGCFSKADVSPQLFNDFSIFTSFALTFAISELGILSRESAIGSLLWRLSPSWDDQICPRLYFCTFINSAVPLYFYTFILCLCPICFVFLYFHTLYFTTNLLQIIIFQHFRYCQSSVTSTQRVSGSFRGKLLLLLWLLTKLIWAKFSFHLQQQPAGAPFAFCCSQNWFQFSCHLHAIVFFALFILQIRSRLETGSFCIGISTLLVRSIALESAFAFDAKKIFHFFHLNDSSDLNSESCLSIDEKLFFFSSR